MDLGPEISDLIVDYDAHTLERLPVSKSSVIDTFVKLKNENAIRIVRNIQDNSDQLNPDAVDDILLRTHYELQRVSELFEQGLRVADVLVPLLRAVRKMDGDTRRPIRIVDIGCGIGFVPRWLAANMISDPLIEFVGTDYNKTLIAEARLLSQEEGLNCNFVTGNAFKLDVPANIYLSTGVLHHFRGTHLVEFFNNQKHDSVLAAIHFDFQATPFSRPGSWLFHEILMREPLARHDGVLSARRAHTGDTLISAANEGMPEFNHRIHNNKLWKMVPRAMHALLSMRPTLSALYDEECK